MVLDAESLRLAPRAAELISAAEGSGLPGTLKSELFASALELNTKICGSPDEAGEALLELRAGAARLAAERGLSLAAAGSHPISHPEDEAIADEPRYAEFVAYAGVSARRQGVSGLHVHVGMPSAEACFHALEAVLPWLPVVLALSANSPYLAGKETGMQSNRAEVLAQLPAAARRPHSRSYAEWEAFVERFARLGIGADYTRFWWDIRPHPKFGTLEIRMPDQPTALAVTVGLVAFSVTCARPYSTSRSRLSIPPRAASFSRTAGQLRASASGQSSSARTAKHGPAPRSSRPRSPAIGSTRPGRRPTASSRSAVRTGVEAVCVDLVARTLG